MGLRTNVEAWAVSFSAVVGVGLVACAGKADGGASEGGTSDSSASSDGNSGGSSSGGSGGSSSGGSGGSSSGGSGGSSSGGSGGSSSGGSGTDVGNTTGETVTTVTSGGGSTATTTTASSTTGSPNRTCSNPVTIGGTVTCDEGFNHRPTQTACPSSLPRDRDVPVGDGYQLGCTRDSDCTEFPHGHCEDVSIDALETACRYGCVEDSDCDQGQLCECGEAIGRCVAASDCVTDADCPGSAFCASYQGEGACSWERVGYACQSDQDLCVGPSDCTGTSGDGCVLGTEGRVCQEFPWVCGRPFLVSGAERRAALGSSRDWLPAGFADESARSSRSTRPLEVEGTPFEQELAERWADVALMEHASVAAFARFTLQLLALGAPAELVAASQKASLDEVAHARACFAIASRYAGKPLGPTALAADGVLGEAELELGQVLELVIREGCFGETMAALAASEGALRAADSAIRHTLEGIANDEREHAALAWRTLAWALEHGDEALMRQVAATFERVATEQAAMPLEHPGEEQLAHHGLIVGTLWGQIQSQAIAQIILPMAAQLLGVSNVVGAPNRESANMPWSVRNILNGPDVRLAHGLTKPRKAQPGY